MTTNKNKDELRKRLAGAELQEHTDSSELIAALNKAAKEASPVSSSDKERKNFKKWD